MPLSGELLADPRRVGVDDLAEQQLGADGDDVAAHRPSPGAVDLPGAARSWTGPRAATRYCAPVTTVRTTATQQDDVATASVASSAVSGSRAQADGELLAARS